jgi:hypothetical protein
LRLLRNLCVFCVRKFVFKPSENLPTHSKIAE